MALAKAASRRISSFKQITGRRFFSSTARTFNFSAGPACIDTEIMETAQSQFVNFNETGMGIIEMSHRDAGGPVQNCIEETSNLVRELLNVPENYHVFFTHGGAHAQFAAVPLNLMKIDPNKNMAGYVDIGHWSIRAMNEASKFVETKVIASGKDSNGKYKLIPSSNEWDLDSSDSMSYIHICGNETIHGLEFLKDPTLPDNAPPLVGDFTSTLFSRKIDISKYGVIYASAGKNFGPAGVCLVIARNDLVKENDSSSINNNNNMMQCPGILDWYEYVNSKPIHSIWNTPPVFQIYMTNLTLKKYKKMCLNEDGKTIDMNKIEQWSKKRAKKIYDIIDNSDNFYFNDIEPQYRSVMNVPFRITKKGDKSNEMQFDTQLEQKFTKLAQEEFNMLQVFGHPLFGGQRITCYNPVPDEAIDTCAQFMTYFMEMHQKAL